MAVFPLLSTDAVAQYPSGYDVQTSTSIVTYVDGTSQAFRNYRRPGKRWILRMHSITQQEFQRIEDFFRAHGTTEAFSFVDPWDGTEYPNCRIASDSLQGMLAGPGRWQSNIVIRNEQV